MNVWERIPYIDVKHKCLCLLAVSHLSVHSPKDVWTECISAIHFLFCFVHTNLRIYIYISHPKMPDHLLVKIRHRRTLNTILERLFPVPAWDISSFVIVLLVILLGVLHSLMFMCKIYIFSFMFLPYFQIRNIILCIPTYLRFTLVYDYFIFISYGLILYLISCGISGFLAWAM